MIDWGVLIYFIGVVLIGGFIGSMYGVKIANEKTIKQLLVIVLIIAGLKRLIQIIL
jgi:uncharacterized membrane protein YfcA